jgi:hypothetical protein
MPKKGPKKSKNKVVPGYQDITWLAGQVFLEREFVRTIEEQGFEAIYKTCPYGDLTSDQRATFEATFNDWRMRMLVRLWWIAYDYLRRRGKIPGVRGPWQP